MPKEFIISTLLIKKAAAVANFKLGLIDKKVSIAITRSVEYLLSNYNQENFPVDVFQKKTSACSEGH